MSERPTVPVPAEMEETRLQLENWRRERKCGQHIPEYLWAKAIELTRQHGLWPAARAPEESRSWAMTPGTSPAHRQ